MYWRWTGHPSWKLLVTSLPNLQEFIQMACEKQEKGVEYDWIAVYCCLIVADPQDIYE